MKSMTKLTRYLVNKFVAILVLSLCIAVSIIGCSSNESEIYEESQESETINTYETEAEETTIEGDDAQEPQLLSCYEYEIQQKTFNFSIDNGESYHIPYVQIQGCPDKRLQWKINHTLWKDACWLFDCAQLDIHIYVIWDDDDPYTIAGIYQYKQYLSVVYEGTEDQRLPGKVMYAIVVNMLTGERVLLSDMIGNTDKFKNMLLHYFDGDEREPRMFILEGDPERILHYGSMTEAEMIVDSRTMQGEYPEDDDGQIDSVTWLYGNISFYMSDDGFIVLPEAKYFEPLIFSWDEMSGIINWK